MERVLKPSPVLDQRISGLKRAGLHE
jgi:hypothetical protein